MKRKSQVLVMVGILLILAACSPGEEPPTVFPTPTPAPTLTMEERATFTAGLAENPLRMVIRPVAVVEERVMADLAQILNVRPAQVTPGASLRDDLNIDDDDLAALNQQLNRDFGVQIESDDAEAILTVTDLTRYVQMRLGERVSDAIFERTSLYVEVVLVDDYGQALSALCDSGSGLVSIPWLDGITYVAAIAQNCGQPGLQVAVAIDGRDEFGGIGVSEPEAETTPEAEVTPEAEENAELEQAGVVSVSNVIDVSQLRVGLPGVIIANGGLGSDDIGLVVGRAFCRLGVNDFYSWFLPVLVMEQRNIDPLRAPSAVVDFENVTTLVRAVTRGDCAATGLPLDTFVGLGSASGVRVVTTTPAFPYGVLMYPLEVGLGVRLSLNENLAEMALDPVDGRPLRLLLGQDALLPATTDDLAELSDFISATGYDFAQLGY